MSEYQLFDLIFKRVIDSDPSGLWGLKRFFTPFRILSKRRKSMLILHLILKLIC